MTQLETDLQGLLNALQALSVGALATGDMATNGTILGAMAQVSAALTLAGAKDIIAQLPGDEDAAKVKKMLGQIGDATNKINAKQKSINDAVSIATNFALLVTQASAGKYVAAVDTVDHLDQLLQ